MINSYMINNFAHTSSVGNEIFTYKKSDSKKPKTFLINVNFGQRTLTHDFFGGHKDTGTTGCSEGPNGYCGTVSCVESGICKQEHDLVPNSCVAANGGVLPYGVRCTRSASRTCTSGMHIVSPTFKSTYESRMCDVCKSGMYSSENNTKNCLKCTSSCNQGQMVVGDDCDQQSGENIPQCILPAGRTKATDAIDAITWRKNSMGTVTTVTTSKISGF